MVAIILYSWKFSQDKIFNNKIYELGVCVVPSWLWLASIHKNFVLRKFPTIGYIEYVTEAKPRLSTSTRLPSQ